MSKNALLQVDCTLRQYGFLLQADFETHAPVTGLFGPSGSGKTTLLQAIAGLLCPHTGFIKLAETPLVNVKGKWWTPPQHRRVGLLFQENRLFPHLSVQDNLEFGYRRVPRHVRRLHPDDVTGFLQLRPLLARPVTALSITEARRVALGRTLLTSPRLLLLDEPLTGLDPLGRREMLNILLDIPGKLDIPILYASPTCAEFLSLGAHVLVIRSGSVQEYGSPERLLEERADADERVDTYLSGVVDSVPEPGYVRIRLGEQSLLATGTGLAPGAHVRVVVPAHEVLLATGEPPRTSASNPLRGSVTRLLTSGPRCLVTVDIGQPLRADITPASARELALEPGTPVLALLKSRGLCALPAVCSQKT